MQSLIASWVRQHPFLVWLLQHPIISLVSFLLLIVLFFRLISALAQLLDKFWLWLLRSPIMLIKSLLRLNSKQSEVKTLSNSQNSIINLDTEQIQQIIQQLETITQQQKQIIEDIKNLKKEEEKTS